MSCASFRALAEAGIQEVVMNTHHLGERMPNLLSNALPQKLDVQFVHEPELLGTGGGIRNVSDFLCDAECALILNGDILFRPNLEAALAHHRAHGAYATMVVRPAPNARKLGVIQRDGEGRVRAMINPLEDRALVDRMFTGVHILSREAIRDLPAEGCVVQQGYRRWLREGKVIAAIDDPNPWRDLGTIGEYARAHLELVKGDNLIGQDVSYGTARVERSLLGHGASVSGGSRLAEVIVWPGVNVDGDYAQCILTGDHIVSFADLV